MFLEGIGFFVVVLFSPDANLVVIQTQKKEINACCMTAFCTLGLNETLIYKVCFTAFFEHSL